MSERFVVDGHLDLAVNIRRHERGTLSKPAHFYREKEGRTKPDSKDQCMVAFPDIRAAGIRLIFATLFENPKDHGFKAKDKILKEWPREAERLFREQVETYRRLESAHPDFKPVGDRNELNQVLYHPSDMGYVILMEGADAIQEPEDAELWWDRGVRIVGLTWNTPNRYAGSCDKPGPLTDDGRALLKEFERLGMIVDLSHSPDEVALEVIGNYGGVVIISHSTSRKLVDNDRLTSDEVFKKLIKREGVLGLAIHGPFLKKYTGSKPKPYKTGEKPTIEDFIRHIDHFAQVAGKTDNIAIGSDLDGGFGAEWSIRGIDTIADIGKITQTLWTKNYSDKDVNGIMGGNWLNILRNAWAK